MRGKFNEQANERNNFIERSNQIQDSLFRNFERNLKDFIDNKIISEKKKEKEFQTKKREKLNYLLFIPVVILLLMFLNLILKWLTWEQFGNFFNLIQGPLVEIVGVLYLKWENENRP